MNPKILKIIIAGMSICIVFLSYKFNEVNNDLKKYKEYYKDLSVMYLNEVIEAPKLEPPSAQDMKVTTIDFDSNVLQFSDLENNIFTIQDFKGKNLFINYWATWCNPCLAEMPYMAELYENYKGEDDIIFLYLSTIYISRLREEMKYKIVETEKGQREKVYKGNTMLYKKTKIEEDSRVSEYEMVVTYYEENIEFGVFKENKIVNDRDLIKFLEDVFLDYMLNNSIPSLDLSLIHI